MIDPEDLLTQKDRIYQSYLADENWVKQEVRNCNIKLKSESKPLIELGLFDVLPERDLYNSGENVLLIEHQLTNKDRVVKPLVEIPKSIYGIYYMPDVQDSWHSDITKDFNCFINRNDPIRQSWFYLLYDRCLLDRAYASFSGLLRCKPNGFTNLDYFDKNHVECLSSFDRIYQEIRNLVPYKNFTENGDLGTTIMATKFSVVIETYFERTDAITFSEKTFRVLQTPRPWLLFHATGSINELRNMGFYVYDDFVDHSYDTLDTTTNGVERQEAILKLTADMVSMTVTPSMIKYWETMTLKNCEILKELNRTWRQDVGKSIIEAYNIASA